MSRKKISKQKKILGIGPMIRRFRKLKHLNQKEFSRLTGIPQSTLSAVETETEIPRADFFQAII
jgi:transcriptional regulator with XRE-family HTH domain